MRRLTALAIAAGIALIVWLLARNDGPAIARTVAGAGPALLVVIALHLPQTLASAWSWRLLLPRPAVGLGESYALRWVRDSINTLLPVAQIGGDVARIRLLGRGGTATSAVATATTIVDVALEVAAQVVFTLAGVLLLVVGGHGGSHDAVTLAWATSLGCVAILAALVALRRFSPLALIERVTAKRLLPGGQQVAELRAATADLHAQPRRLAISAAGHVVAWALGSLETWAGLWAIGVPASAGEAVVIEALGHVARAVGFFIPGALGIQEGGYVLVCGLYGIGAPDALSLSMIKRLRELALGLPGLLVWGWMERRSPDAPTS